MRTVSLCILVAALGGLEVPARQRAVVLHVLRAARVLRRSLG